MKKTAFLLAIAFVCISLASCTNHVMHGKGPKVTKTITPAQFTELEISINSEVTINVQPGAQPSVEIVACENHQKHIVTRSEANRLIIEDDLKPNWTFGPKKEIEFKITVASLEQLELDGASDAAIHGNLTGPSFSLDLSGAVKVAIDSVNVQSLSAAISGAGDIEVKGGTAKTASYDISGAAKVRTFPLVTGETTTSVSGAAKAEVNATEKLNVDISGAGKVRYKGHPAITKDISGAGSVTDAN